MKKKESQVYKLLKRYVDDWDAISLNISNELVPLPKIIDEAPIAELVIRNLKTLITFKLNKKS